MRKLLLVTAPLLLLAAGPSAFVGNTTVWDSAVQVDPANGIFPVGGSGQIPGDFQVKVGRTKTGQVQVGIRAQERFVGPIAPEAHRRYVAPAGESFLGRAAWNFDFHFDFGSGLSQVIDSVSTAPIGPTDHTSDDFTLYLMADCDPAKNVRPVEVPLNGPDAPAVLAGFNGIGAKLLQGSWNMGFDFLENLVCVPQGFATFPFDASGEYEMGLLVRERKAKGAKSVSAGKVVAQVKMTVVVE